MSGLFFHGNSQAAADLFTDSESGARPSQLFRELKHPLSNCSTEHNTLPAPNYYRNYQHTRGWSGKVEEEVCILDSGFAPGGEGDCERNLGCSGGEPSSGRLGGEPVQEGPVIATREGAELFFFDGNNDETADTVVECVYERYDECILGDESNDISLQSARPEPEVNRCFNCGSASHFLTSCPLPLDHKLIALSRQMHGFFQTSSNPGGFQRIHVVEGWKQQRLNWLSQFEPGEIRGEALLDALGSSDGDWLKNMSIWGYPKGWVGHLDPRDVVRDRIRSENSGSEQDASSDSEDEFLIIGDGEQTESIIFPKNLDFTPSLESISENTGFDTMSDSGSSSTNSENVTQSSLEEPAQPPKRWANYPPSYFSSNLLPIYSGFALPPIHGPASATYTHDRRALWERIISAESPGLHRSTYENDPVPPWRRHGSFEIEIPVQTNPPPPPPVTPPPLPPSPPSDPSLLVMSIVLPPVTNALNSGTEPSTFNASSWSLDEEADMDMSDSE